MLKYILIAVVMVVAGRVAYLADMSSRQQCIDKGGRTFVNRSSRYNVDMCLDAEGRVIE